MTKEQAYDNMIAPLIAKIIAVCKKHKIGCLADFALGGDLKCTTYIEVDESANPEMTQAYYKLCNKSQSLAITVRDKDNKIVRQEVIL